MPREERVIKKKTSQNKIKAEKNKHEILISPAGEREKIKNKTFFFKSQTIKRHWENFFKKLKKNKNKNILKIPNYQKAPVHH